ncbi:MAG: hypothetical protein FRX48_05940 [Lasallia pustulata]|uniref:Mediator of RNA polymerase II transcription subunit 4 n=1 Tax=Lasallia pustulata TaxID=136370 RepID=A0A5M8PNF0_9LECA|nr:MAG: hypothetical protein FRX48_05940 [Lasallia pustulata]
MDAILQSQLDRVETALNTLLDSITTYNPSVPAALDLLSADTDLTRGLNQLCAHQHNHRRILSLRATASALDSHLASTLTLLASTRADLVSTPTTSIPATHRPVPYPSLLSYAKHISKFTQPPPGTPNPDAQSPKPKSANGADTPSADPAAGDAPPERAAGLGVAALQPGEGGWLDPGAQVAWGPWPSEEVIRRGALARIQVLLEQGVDPESPKQPYYKPSYESRSEKLRNRGKMFYVPQPVHINVISLNSSASSHSESAHPDIEESQVLRQAPAQSPAQFQSSPFFYRNQQRAHEASIEYTKVKGIL